MLSTKEKVAMNLCYLIQGDYELTNDIIIEYLDLVSNKRLEDLLEFSNNEMRANVQSLYHYYSMLSFYDYLIKWLDSML